MIVSFLNEIQKHAEFKRLTKEKFKEDYCESVLEKAAIENTSEPESRILCFG